MAAKKSTAKSTKPQAKAGKPAPTKKDGKAKAGKTPQAETLPVSELQPETAPATEPLAHTEAMPEVTTPEVPPTEQPLPEIEPALVGDP